VGDTDGAERVAIPLGIGQAVFLVQPDGASGRNRHGGSNETRSDNASSAGSPPRREG
jgi:hypothetical protein